MNFIKKIINCTVACIKFLHSLNLTLLGYIRFHYLTCLCWLLFLMDEWWRSYAKLEGSGLIVVLRRMALSRYGSGLIVVLRRMALSRYGLQRYPCVISCQISTIAKHHHFQFCLNIVLWLHIIVKWKALFLGQVFFVNIKKNIDLWPKCYFDPHNGQTSVSPVLWHIKIWSAFTWWVRVCDYFVDDHDALALLTHSLTPAAERVYLSIIHIYVLHLIKLATVH